MSPEREQGPGEAAVVHRSSLPDTVRFRVDESARAAARRGSARGEPGDVGLERDAVDGLEVGVEALEVHELQRRHAVDHRPQAVRDLLGARARCERFVVEPRLRRGARELVLEKGADALSLREVGARAGYSPASLYEYFDSKESLVGSLLPRPGRKPNAVRSEALSLR